MSELLVVCLGDVMLDVLVQSEGLVPDDDVPARISFRPGGQAANVAAWVVALGARARVVGPRADRGHGRLVADALTARGVEVAGPEVSRPGSVLSLVTAGTRSLASDPGDPWVDDVRPGPWLDGADWLLVSGYALLRARDPGVLSRVAEAARGQGTRVAVDLASAQMIADSGAAAFRAAWQALEPAAVFATDAEWAATRPGDAGGPAGFGTGGRSVLVLKHGPRGATFVIDGVADDRGAPPGPVVDSTGGGDALAAGYLVGGVDLAMETAARCVARVGAQPPERE